MPPTYYKKDAKEEWEKIPSKLEEGLKGCASRDFCALECLANARLYAKPDSQKIFLLWQAKNLKKVIANEREIEGVRIEKIPSAQEKHRWVYSLFIGGNVVRFPFNTWDADWGDSLSWCTINENLRVGGFENRLLQLPRWSTASRSCLALIPKSVNNLSSIGGEEWNTMARFQLDVEDNPNPNVPEWKSYQEKRFCYVVGDPGRAASSTGTVLLRKTNGNGRHRLYSVKTGVKYVGSKEEGRFGKNRLEANCSMAMLRSEAIEAMHNNDKTFGVQTEVLTITAPLEQSVDDKNRGVQPRDGFQVRDLSCMQPGYDYIPGQAIPYARAAFDKLRKGSGNDEEYTGKQCDFWRKAFAVPLGRAKARLFLNYGLVHTSANAQNFLLGFQSNNCKQFVARDLGDTSWHDDYLMKYFKNNKIAEKVYDSFNKESSSDIKHILHETSSGDYPPPHIMRLAAYSVLTHGFATKLKTEHHWGEALLYKFATGILDGFRDFIQEVFAWNSLYPRESNELSDDSIKSHGVDGKYPSGTTEDQQNKYKSKVDELLKQDARTLFGKAAAVRRSGLKACTDDGFGKFKQGAADGICTLINAEEILLCAGLENRLIKKFESKDQISGKLKLCLIGHWPEIVPTI